MPHTLLSLNYDILASILPLISPHDAAQLALTCRAAYALALPRFLSDVSLGGLYHKPGGSAVAQLTAFCKFVLAPAPRWHGAPTARLDGLQSLEVMRDAVRVRKAGAWTTDPAAVALLSNVLERAHSLRRLTLWGSATLFAACPDFGRGLGLGGGSTAVRTLVLGGDVAPLPELARAFPNVRELVFVGANGACPPDWAYTAPTEGADADELGPWQGTLERVETGFAVAPLACAVRRVDVRGAVMDGLDAVLPAREFLGRTRPVVLSVPVSTRCSPEEIGGMLELAAPWLRFLEVFGDRCEGLKEGEDWARGRVAAALAILPALAVLGISISVTPAVMPTTSSWKPSGETFAPAPLPDKTPAQPVDLDALARTVAESAPSLRFVAIDLTSAAGSTGSEHAYYRVHDTGRVTRRVAKMSIDGGKAMIAKMRAFNEYD